MSIEKTRKGMFAKAIAFVTVAILFFIANVITAKAEPTEDFLTFTAKEAGSTITVNYGRCENDTWYYSINDGNWVEEHGDGITITLENEGDTVKLKAKKFRASFDMTPFRMTGKIAASGSVTSLIDENGGDENVALEDWCFQALFKDCTALVDVSELNLPATNLAGGCYESMFDGCTSLTEAPELPATTLAPSCYAFMFQGCTGLTEAPELPATTLEYSCYTRMFMGCTGLTEAPELPATTLASGCYCHMFNGCTSLTEAPELPATTLDQTSYASMFANCTSLTEAPELPATTLAYACYERMFMNSGITEVPELPATTLEVSCYQDMFANCTGLRMWYEPKDDLRKEWKIPATSDPGSAANTMFVGCPGADFCLDPSNTSLDTPVLNRVYYVRGSQKPDPTPTPQPTPSTNKDNDDSGKKKESKKSSNYVDLDTNKSELPYGYVLMLNLEDMKVLQDMKVHPVDSKTNTNQQFLTQMFANQMGKKARILLTKSIHPRNPLTKEQLGVKKYLKWFHLEKKAQPIYAVCYNETDKAYYMTGTLDENGTALLRDFIARDATNITLFVLE